MAWYIIPRPGSSKLAPCSTRCAHADCNESHNQAGQRCVYCNLPIGYDVKVTVARQWTPAKPTVDLAHFGCALAAAAPEGQ